MQRHLRIYAAAALIVAAAGAQAAVVVITKNLNSPESIPGVTNFVTTGAEMSGMSVTATFSGGLNETLAWTTTGATSGGVASTNWGLSVDGDTFGASWMFSINSQGNLGQLTSLILDGKPGLTVFDTAEPNTGTTGSEAGRDFDFASGCPDCEVIAAYSNAVEIASNGPVGDLFHRLTLTFVNNTNGNPTGPRANWSFRQDTDNDSRINQTPEPGSIALAGLALLALGAVRRRRAP